MSVDRTEEDMGIRHTHSGSHCFSESADMFDP